MGLLVPFGVLLAIQAIKAMASLATTLMRNPRSVTRMHRIDAVFNILARSFWTPCPASVASKFFHKAPFAYLINTSGILVNSFLAITLQRFLHW